MSDHTNESKRPDAAVSPAEAQNSGPPHRTPPGPQEPATTPSTPTPAKDPELPAGGRPDLRDDT